MGEKSCENCGWAFGNACTAPINVDCDEKTLVAWKPSPVVFDEEMRSEEERPYYKVVLTASSRTRTVKTTRHESNSYEHQEELRGLKITFEERFLKLESKETWGGVFGMEKGERDYTFWIPYDAILYIEFVERKYDKGEK